jgi:hypothetical protein
LTAELPIVCRADTFISVRVVSTSFAICCL